MAYALLYGLGIGVILSSMLGTVFFFLVQNSIANGFKSSIFIAAGVISSDVLLIVLSYFNANLFPSGGYAESLVRIGGAILLLVMGVSNIRKHSKPQFAVPVYHSPWLLASKGFMLNALNPGNYISWLSISALLINVNHYSLAERWWFYTGALLSIFGMEMLIAVGAAKIKAYISEKFMRRLDLVLGIVFLVFAFVLLWPMLRELFK